MYVDKDQRIGVMSIGFLLSGADEAVVWRGPKKNGKRHKAILSITPTDTGI